MPRFFTLPNSTNGYYHLSIQTRNQYQPSNKPTFLYLLTHYLSPRIKFNSNDDVIYRYSDSLDLLAFSIDDNRFELVIHTVSNRILRHFLGTLKRDFCFYTNNDCCISVHQLTSQQAALEKTISVHKMIPQSRYTPYSSLGFYVNDRRGDWVRLWRMANLLGEDFSAKYQKLLDSTESMWPELDSSKNELSPLPKHQLHHRA